MTLVEDYNQQPSSDNSLIKSALPKSTDIDQNITNSIHAAKSKPNDSILAENSTHISESPSSTVDDRSLYGAFTSE